jgi:hypothetical protein
LADLGAAAGRRQENVLCPAFKFIILAASATSSFGSWGLAYPCQLSGDPLPANRVCEPVTASRRSERSFAGNFRLNCLSILAALSHLVPQLAHSQETETVGLTNTPLEPNTLLETDTPAETDTGVMTRTPAIQPVESELIVEGLASYGNYRIFASGRDCKLYTAGVEYDRHSWGYLLRARVDYVAEVLPLILLNEPAQTTTWGSPLTYARQIVPGVGISPIGFRILWRSNKAIKPYLLAKGGILVFDKKVLSSEATYQNFSLQSAAGVQVKLTQRLDLRLGLFSDFHFSNAFAVPINPGLDVMNANLGLSYHFRK